MRKATNHLRTADSRLGNHIELVGPCRLKPARAMTPFLGLAESIAYQQLTGKAAQTIWNRVLSLAPSERSFTPKLLDSVSDEQLRAAGLSGSKVLALRSLAEHCTSGIVPGWAKLERLDDDEIIARITQVRGIGPWTVQMLLIFSMGRLDVLPATDYGVQKGFALVYRKRELPKPKALLEFGERWKPFRSVAAWYLWRATDLEKKGVGRA